MNQSEETSKKLDGFICSVIWCEKSKNKLKRLKKLVENGADIHSCSCHVSPIYFALKLQCYRIIQNLLNRGAHFGVTQSTGPFAGFTALHHALLNDDIAVASDLIIKYKVDPTGEATDGVQPIHLAVLRRHYSIVLNIVKTGVDIESKLSYCHYQKYAQDIGQWNHDLGDEMTLLTYAIFNDNYSMTQTSNTKFMSNSFISNRTNHNVNDRNNQTLLMRAIKSNMIDFATIIISQCSTQELDKRDNRGFAAIHYLTSPVDNNECKNLLLKVDNNKRVLLECLGDRGIDMNLMIKNDQSTLPVHMAAYYGFERLVQWFMLKQNLFTPLVQPLSYAVRMKIIGSDHRQINHPLFYRDKVKMVKTIIEDIYVKCLCKYPVHKEEIEIMERLIKNKKVISKFFPTLEPKYNEVFSSMVNLKIFFRNQNLSLYDVLTAPQKDYFRVAKDENYKFEEKKSELDLLNFTLFNNSQIWKEINMLCSMIDNRLKESRRRLDLLKKFDIVAYHAIKSFLLPYDCISRVVEYLFNVDLENFINSFFIAAQ